VKGKSLIICLVIIAAAIAGYRWLPSYYNPFAPLTLDDPPGTLTQFKLRRLRPEHCDVLLAQANARQLIRTQAVADSTGECPLSDVVRVRSFGPVSLSSSFLASCPLALSSALFVNQQARPITETMMGSSLSRIEHFGSFACRNIYHRANARRSEHATAEALDISERVAAEQTLQQLHKMEALGNLTGGIAHDFNNLLMAVLGSLELLRRRMPADPALLRLVDNARAGAERGASLTARMLSFARKQELHKTPIDLRQLIQGMQALLLSSLGPTIQLEVELPQRLARVKTDPNQLETALLNLAANARDAMGGEGRILIVAEQVTLSSEQHGLAAGRYVRLNVSDSGTGMDETTLKRAVEPFFTTKGIGKGTGLGLSMVHGLAEQSGGRLVLRSSPGAGTTAQIWLPALEDEPAAEPTHSPLPHDLPRRTTRPLSVLAVDDDELVLFGTAGMLEAAGHHVLTARSAAQALELLQVAQIDMLVTDHAMPLMSGAQLAAEVRASRPELPILLVSGYAELPSATPALPLQRLAKPFTQDQLLDAVEQLRADVC